MLRTLQLTSQGPLVFMFIKMLDDVLRLTTLMCFVILAIASGIYVILEAQKGLKPDELHTPLAGLQDHVDARVGDVRVGDARGYGVSLEPATLPDQCEDFVDMQGDFTRWENLLFVLFNGAFLGYVQHMRVHGCACHPLGT